MKDVKITPEVIQEHNLTEEEYSQILQILGREPNITELGIFSVLWSEHCSYKSSKVHLKKFPTKGPYVIQGPGENAGVIDIGYGLTAVFKMESHNHPSFIEPYQGAATGVGGILRDVFTMGARPIALLDSLRFGNPENPRTRYLVEGVVSGIAGYGNCIGIPTVGGEIYLDDCYDGNILVNVFTVGVAKKDRIFKGVAGGVGNPVIYVGAKTGRDGIHGATMASEEFDKESEEKRPTVQVGDPFMEKLLLEACLELMKTDCIVGIQDMGAAGLTSSSFEMAGRAGNGIEMDLDLVPLREEGMTPYEIMLSESQERMLLVAKKGKEGEVIDIFKKWDLDAVVIGIVTDDGVVRIREKGATVAELPVKPLTTDAPVYDRPHRIPEYQEELNRLDVDTLDIPDDLESVFRKLISSVEGCDKSWIYRQYDHMIRTNTVVLPGSDAAVLRVKGTTLGIAISVDCNSRYCYLDPFQGGQITVAEAARNIAVSGARPLALTDCLNFGNPEKPEIMWQFKNSVEGIAHACNVLDTPVVSGNVSFYNETMGRGIFPTPAIAMVGVIKDYTIALAQFFREAGHIIYLVGPDQREEDMGGSLYLKEVQGLVKGLPPMVDLDYEKRLHRFLVEGTKRFYFESAHDISEGGLAVALAECSFPPSGDPMGCTVINPYENLRPDAALFGETQGRVIISLKPEKESDFLKFADENGMPVCGIGKTGGKRFIIEGFVDIDINEAYTIWKESFRKKISL
jgi:phosphoribosylformylglycinamidine synthase II